MQFPGMICTKLPKMPKNAGNRKISLTAQIPNMWTSVPISDNLQKISVNLLDIFKKFREHLS